MNFSSPKCTWFNLPVELWLRVFDYCSDRDLLSLQCCCTFFHDVVNNESLWIRKTKNARLALAAKDACMYAHKELYKFSRRWCRGIYHEEPLIQFRFKFQPWLQVKRTGLWITQGSQLCFYAFNAYGRLQKPARTVFENHLNSKEDFCRFSCVDSVLAAGTRQGDILLFNAETKSCLSAIKAHASDVHSVDVTDGLIVSGSRDATVKLWRYGSHEEILPLETMNVNDRAWTVAIASDKSTFAIGTAFNRPSLAPLIVCDLQRCSAVDVVDVARRPPRGGNWTSVHLPPDTNPLGAGFKKGAGVLHVLYEDPRLLLSTGYDTYVRLWDLRIGKSVLVWEELFDNAVFSLTSDKLNSVFAGSCRHGLVWAFDKRSKRPVQKFYVGNHNRPVYSLGFNARTLFCALDAHLSHLRF